MLLEHDYEVEQRLRELGRNHSVRFISCKGLVSNTQMMRQLQEMMQVIQAEYQQPVDIEFTLNLDGTGEYMINLLQCRPLQVFRDTGEVFIPDALPPERILMSLEGASMGLSREVPLDLIVYVDPVAYYNLPYREKDSVAKAVRSVNWKYRGSGKHMMLIVPGRIGTSSPKLGVPTTFADISEFEVICEVAESGAGYNPELSYGSHIFQDLVEAQILYTAVFEGKQTKAYHPENLTQLPNLLAGLFPEHEKLDAVIRIVDVSARNCIVYHDLRHEKLIVTV